MDTILEEKLLDELRWQNGKECLNLKDIHMPPYYFDGSRAEWISQLTTFCFLHPREWEYIKNEYVQHSEDGGKRGFVFMYERTDEGELRRVGETDIFLRIAVPDTYHHLKEVAEWFLESDIMDFYCYEKYCDSSSAVRREILQRIVGIVVEYIRGREEIKDNTIQVTFAMDYSEGLFEGRELFIDILNRMYLIL